MKYFVRLLGLLIMAPVFVAVYFPFHVAKSTNTSVYEVFSFYYGPFLVFLLVLLVVSGVGVFLNIRAIRLITLFFGSSILVIRLFIEIFGNWDVTYWDVHTTIWFLNYLFIMISLSLPPVAKHFNKNKKIYT